MYKIESISFSCNLAERHNIRKVRVCTRLWDSKTSDKWALVMRDGFWRYVRK